MGIWLDNNFYTADKNTGIIKIPFLQQSKTDTVIVVYEDFACLKKVTLTSEKYSFDSSFIYNEESFVEGTKAKVLI